MPNSPQYVSPRRHLCHHCHQGFHENSSLDDHTSHDSSSSNPSTSSTLSTSFSMPFSTNTWSSTSCPRLRRHDTRAKMIWPRDKTAGGKWERLKDILAGRGPDIWIVGPKEKGPSRLAWSNWLPDTSPQQVDGCFETPKRRYNFHTRRYVKSSLIRPVQWAAGDQSRWYPVERDCCHDRQRRSPNDFIPSRLHPSRQSPSCSCCLSLNTTKV